MRRKTACEWFGGHVFICDPIVIHSLLHRSCTYGSQMDVPLAKLGRFIADHFDQDQLRALCRDAGISYDQLVGATRSSKAFDLVTLARNRGRLPALVAAIERIYPDAFDSNGTGPKRSRQLSVLWRWAFSLVLGAGVIFAFYIVFSTTQTRQSLPTPTIRAALVSTPVEPVIIEAPSPTILAQPTLPSPTRLVATPTAIPPTRTPEATSLPSPSDTELPTKTPTPTSVPPDTPSRALDPTSPPTPKPSAIPLLPQLSPALFYDADTETLTMTPGSEILGRARLCTPLHPYFSLEAVYFIDNQVQSLGLRLPANVRITHTYPEVLGDEIKVGVFEARRHPIEGFKISGEAANMVGCDLTLNQGIRAALGFPLDLGEFDDAPRFDHGWVTIEFLTVSQDTP